MECIYLLIARLPSSVTSGPLDRLPWSFRGRSGEWGLLETEEWLLEEHARSLRLVEKRLTNEAFVLNGRSLQIE